MTSDDVAVFFASYLYLVQVALALIYFLLQQRPRQLEMIAFGVVYFPLVFLLAEGVGLFYFDPRPFVVEHFTPLIPHVPDNGFPSDHALLTSAVATAALFFDWPMGLILWLLALLVGAARVYVGLHHPIDVLGAYAFSIALCPLGYFAAKRWIGPPLLRRFGGRLRP